MKTRDIVQLGIPHGPAINLALAAFGAAMRTGREDRDVRAQLRAVAAQPTAFLDDPLYGRLAAALGETRATHRVFTPRAAPAPWRQWGTDLEAGAVQQMERACQLPVAAAGALLPDAHVGYGLPIGGVLATRNVVIPYAVGMDIACRMKLTVLDLPVSQLRGAEGLLRNTLAAATRFGVGGGFTPCKEHPVLDEDWSVSPVTRQCRDKAAHQLGSSGSGNHFVEFGTLTLAQDEPGLKAGVYTALLSHSGSRGTGGRVATHYSRLAMDRHPELPRELQQLAWLDLAGADGQEYWAAMQLMGRYAAANHFLIHREVARLLKCTVLLDIENHHNFAWRERHFGEDVIVHRKGATPAGEGVLGIIPGSMATPGYVVRGRGATASLNSASHGAGRRMSRTATRNSFTWNEAKKLLAARDVVLISAGLDEVPMGYKDIERVMAAQRDLVAIIARFDPKLVKMAPEGEQPED
jgi:tRNA-splicing ligase RtcB